MKVRTRQLCVSERVDYEQRLFAIIIARRAAMGGAFPTPLADVVELFRFYDQLLFISNWSQ